MAKVKCLLSIRGWQMGESKPAPLPLTGNTGTSPVMLAAQCASMWGKQRAQLLYEWVEPAHDSGDDEDHGEP